MKMMLSLKSMSRTVHEEHHEDEEEEEEEKKTDEEGTSSSSSTSLTVWRKSLIISCNGFTVIDSNGNLVYRVDNYIGRRSQEVILMDGLGKSILTVRRHPKKLRLLENWLVYEGDVGDDNCGRTKSSKKPIYCVEKNNRIILNANSSVLAHVYLCTTTTSDKRRYGYVIEGSYANRSCKVLDKSRKVVAEIKRKEATIDGVSFGLEVFVLIVHPGFDRGFAMALILLLDQMF